MVAACLSAAAPVPSSDLSPLAVVDGVVNLRWHRGGGLARDPARVRARTGIRVASWTTRAEDAGRLLGILQRRDHVVQPVLSALDLDQAERNGRLGVLLYVQDPKSALQVPGDLDRLFDQGVRVLQLAWDRATNLGGGPGDDEASLTRLGRGVIQRANELGVLVDLSHCGRRTTLEAAEASSSPVTANHANATAIFPAGRNKSDAELRAIAATGGVVGVTTIGRFLSAEGDRLQAFLDHVDHMVSVIGVAHVGVASDSWLDGSKDRDRDRAGGALDREGRWRAVAEGLRDRGYASSEVAAILGENFLRVYRAVLPRGPNR